MKAQFNSINKSNQSIKLSSEILKKLSTKIKYQSYSYNNFEVFKYFSSIKESKILIQIHPSFKVNTSFHSKLIGSFIYNMSNKYSANQIEINSSNKVLLNNIVFGFCQKDFIYSIYKKGSKKFNFKTTFKNSSENSNLLQSINFLKELVSEPSNII